MGEDDQSHILFLICQGTLLWQPISGPNRRNGLSHLHSATD